VDGNENENNNMVLTFECTKIKTITSPLEAFIGLNRGGSLRFNAFLTF